MRTDFVLAGCKRGFGSKSAIKFLTVFLSPAILFASPFVASAQNTSIDDSERIASELLFNCPSEGTIRVAGAASVSRFQSLRGCVDQIAIAPPEMVMRTPSPVRIESDYNENDPFNRVAPDEDSGTRTILANDIKAKKHKVRGSKRKGNGSNEAPLQSEFSKTVLRSRPIDVDDVRMVRIAPDAQEIGEWEQVAAAEPTGVIASGTSQPPSEGGAILTLRPRSYSTSHDALISQVAIRYSIDPLLLHAVIKQESGYRSSIRSHAGAVGLMQIMPGTGRMLGVQSQNLTDPASNVDAGARLLRQLHGRFSGNFDLVLAAYNAGEGAVKKYGNTIPPYRETQNYVRSVKAHYVRLLAENGYSGAVF